MILNFVFLAFVIGAQKKKMSPYVAALLVGLFKGFITYMGSRLMLGSCIVGCIYAMLVATFVYFLRRIDAKEDKEKPAIPVYGLASASKIKFKWEYVPLVILFMLIIGGELLFV